MNSFSIQIKGETDVLSRLFFALTLEKLMNSELSLSDYAQGASVQQVRIHLMAYKPMSLSQREDDFRFRPQAGRLEIDLNLEYELFAQATDEQAQSMIADFLLFAAEEYIAIAGFDNLALAADLKQLFQPYLLDD